VDSGLANLIIDQKGMDMALARPSVSLPICSLNAWKQSRTNPFLTLEHPLDEEFTTTPWARESIICGFLDLLFF
jgi:hypothetical protein